MEFTSIFFIILSFIVVLYLLYIFKTNKRTSLLLEMFYVGIYFFVGIIFLFPQTLSLIENFFGIQSAINFIVYLSIFISYLLILMLYNKLEDQRVEITKLVREIAYLKENKDDKKENKILIALPAYNEAKVIEKVILDIKKEGFRNILIVDDCSKDSTFEVAKKAEAIVLKHIINRGAGAATYTALIYARENNYDYVVFLDSDGQHNPKDIKKLFLVADKYDVIIGSRMIGNISSMPIHRRIANIIGSLITGFFFGKFVKDSQSGFKVFNRNAIEKINLTFDRYEFCSEIIGEIYKHKLTVKEVPIEVIYTNHSKGKGQSIKNGFKMIFKFILRR